jgi:hypothetical protein
MGTPFAELGHIFQNLTLGISGKPAYGKAFSLLEKYPQYYYTYNRFSETS